MRVVAFAPDLMDQSRIRAAAGAHELVFVRGCDALVAGSGGADLVLVDLSRPGVLDVVGSVGAATIGFGSHVDDELLAAARAAGCGEVLPRSRFFRHLADLLAR